MKKKYLNSECVSAARWHAEGDSYIAIGDRLGVTQQVARNLCVRGYKLQGKQMPIRPRFGRHTCKPKQEVNE